MEVYSSHLHFNCFSISPISPLCHTSHLLFLCVSICSASFLYFHLPLSSLSIFLKREWQIRNSGELNDDIVVKQKNNRKRELPSHWEEWQIQQGKGYRRLKMWAEKAASTSTRCCIFCLLYHNITRLSLSIKLSSFSSCSSKLTDFFGVPG